MVCFCVKSSLDFSNVTEPSEPYCPFITGPKFDEEDDGAEESAAPGTAGALKHRSNKAAEPFSTSNVDEVLTTKSRRLSLTAVGFATGWSGPSLGIGNDGLGDKAFVATWEFMGMI